MLAGGKHDRVAGNARAILQADPAGLPIRIARLGWQATPQVALSVNVNNLFDKRYIIPSYNTTGSNNYYGDPRNVQFTLKYTPKW